MKECEEEPVRFVSNIYLYSITALQEVRYGPLVGVKKVNHLICHDDIRLVFNMSEEVSRLNFTFLLED